MAKILTKKDTQIEKKTNVVVSKNLKNKIQLTKEPMYKLIKKFRSDKTIGFAHSISSDFYHPRHMTVGVAVIFKNKFGRPRSSECLSSHLALQNIQHGVAVYNLIMKSSYSGKPESYDYDATFQDLTIDFKMIGLRYLICSPIGCVRDNIELDNFFNNLKLFQNQTKADITIVSYYQKSYRQLRNGLSHEDFNKQLQTYINSESIHHIQSTPGSDSSPLRNNVLASADMSTPATSQQCSPTPTETLHTRPHTSTDQATPVASEQCENVSKVVPGDLTYSESLKQSTRSVGVLSVKKKKQIPLLIIVVMLISPIL